MREKLNLKTISLMVVVMLLIVFIYFYNGGFFQINSTFSDVVSTSKAQAIASGDHWELCEPEKEGRMPYFAYNGSLDPSPHVSGRGWQQSAGSDEVTATDNVQYHAGIYAVGEVYYTASGSDEMQSESIEQFISDDNHFFVGQQRWHLDGYDEKNIVKASFKIEWQDALLTKAETISSKDLTPEEMQRAKEWIENTFVSRPEAQEQELQKE